MQAPVINAGFFLVALGLAASAVKAAEDPNARLVACYDKVHVEATYNVRHELVQAAYRKYVKRGNRIELWEYPPVYEEIKTVKKPAHYVMVEIPCNK